MRERRAVLELEREKVGLEREECRLVESSRRQEMLEQPRAASRPQLS